MSNYNTTLQSNNTDLQTVLQTLQTKAAGGEQATPVITVNNSNGLITATAGTKTSTHQLAFQTAKTITPTTANQIAVSSGYYTGGAITVKGDSNLIAENIKNGVSIFGVNGTLEESSGSGEAAEWSENEDMILNRKTTNYFNDRLSVIGGCAFAGCTQLTTVNFPKCITIECFKPASSSFFGAFCYCSNLTSVSFPAATTIGDSTFYFCSKLATASFPAATTIGSYAFYCCFNLTTVSFPTATYIGSSAFYFCSSLTTVSFPAATYIGGSAFYSCVNLTTASFTEATTVGYGAFYKCSKLTTVSFPAATTISGFAFCLCFKLTTASFPEATSIGSSAFCSCSSLTSTNFPAATTIGSYAFYYCSSLTTVSFPAATSIGNSAFYCCYRLISLYLTGSSLCTLVNSRAFASTPIGGYWATAGTYGSIYVPASLLASYQTATNWTYFSSRFVGIPDNDSPGGSID